jgi:hypothetical protein
MDQATLDQDRVDEILPAPRHLTRDAISAIKLRSLSNAQQTPELVGLETTVDDAIDDNRKQGAMHAMISNGWCSHQVKFLAQTFHGASFTHLSRLQRSPIRAVDHTLCLQQPKCIAFNADMENYRRSHVHNRCQCGDISVLYEELTEIIRNKEGVPLVSIEEDEYGDLQLKLHHRKDIYTYTVISHVWSDGLGNPNNNALPRCQVQNLKEQLECLHGHGKQVRWRIPPLCFH